MIIKRIMNNQPSFLKFILDVIKNIMRERIKIGNKISVNVTAVLRINNIAAKLLEFKKDFSTRSFGSNS
jgi:hypothetical protein